MPLLAPLFASVRWTLVAALWLASGPLFAANPLEEISALSGMQGLDAHRLTRGEIITARGTQGNFPRGVYAESCYYIKSTPDAVKTALLHWDPSRYKETEVSGYRTYHWPSTPDVFGTFRLESTAPPDRTLLDWTAAAATRGEAGELHLRPDELAAFQQTFAGHDVIKSGERETLANSAWQALLQRHSDAVGGGGLAALPGYKANGVTIQAADEFNHLLRMTPAIAGRFAPLTGARPLFADGAGIADEVVPYAEESLVRSHTSFCLGAIAALRTSEGWLAFDCTYYTADTYFFSVALYQMWPWEDGTLVWEVDYASAPFRSFLGGIDRVFAGKEMTKDSTQSVQTFRKAIAAQGR